MTMSSESWTDRAQYCKTHFFRGVKKVYAVGPDPGRLKIGESFGCIGVDVGTYASVHPAARAARVG